MKKILIVSANYYKDISKNLIINAKKKLQNAKFNSSLLIVPGVYEIPIAIRKNMSFFQLLCIWYHCWPSTKAQLKRSRVSSEVSC